MTFVYSLKLYRHQLRDTCLLHRYAIKSAGHLHRPLVVRDHDELRVLGHLDDLISKASHVRFVKWSVDLVEQAERRGPGMEDAEHERERRHRLLTAGEKQNVLETFARRLRNHVDARLEHVVRVDEVHLTASAAKQLLEQRAEVFVDLLERVTETFARAPFDLAQRLFSCGDAIDD